MSKSLFIILLTILHLILFYCPSNAKAPEWKPIQLESISSSYPIILKPKRFLAFELNPQTLLQEFSKVPKEKPGKIREYGKIITLPLPSGDFQRFAFVSTELMEPDLKEKWSFIKTFTGQGIDDPSATVKVDFTVFGFHYQIRSAFGLFYADPIFYGDNRYYHVYDKKDLDIGAKGIFMEFDTEHQADIPSTGEILSPTGPSLLSSGNILRTYRIAIATTGEYTSYHGGKIQAASAIATTLNRINGLYENDLAIRFILVANNDLLIYTNASSDPYSNTSGSTMLGQNQNNITAVIGAANYDIGHVFSTGGGGVAGKGVVCNSSSKARGVTGSSSPIGDPFDIDYVAHEIGHQFGGSHTFNSQTGSCGGNNRSASTAYEPGSGSTIMAYAGICGNDNIQSSSDAHFNFKSYEEIIAFSQTGGGNACPVRTNTGNSPPQIPALTGGVTIPINTPFLLKSPQATDPDLDTLTYCWEQNDLGPAGTIGNPSGDAPIIRSFPPSLSPDRTIPRTPSLLNNTTVPGERLPSYSRNLKFKLTVRDNNGGAGGVAIASINLAVNSSGGPFSVTSPNTSSVAWEAGSNQTVTWNPGNTASAPFNTPQVRVLLSTDGGNSFPYLLKDSVLNDGSELVTLPVITSNTCRIRVEAKGNIFFDISNSNFRITAPTSANIAMTFQDTLVCAGQTFPVAIVPTDTIYNPDNLFSLQLSNASGQFTSPQTIGTLSGTQSGILNATIPTTASGNGYRLRVVSSNPVRTSLLSPMGPKIKGLPGAPGNISGPTQICPGDSTRTFSVNPNPAFTGFLWSLPSGCQILTKPDSNAIRILFAGPGGAMTVKGVNSCGAGSPATLALAPIQVNPAVVNATASSLSPCSGTSVLFTAIPTNGGNSPTFQWLKNEIPIPGATNPTYSTALLQTGDKLKVILVSSLSCGENNSDTSSSLNITVVQPRTPTITIESNALNDTSCQGEAVTFTSQANAAGGTNPKYAWFKNTSPIAGQAGQTLMLTNLASGDSIRARFTVSGNCLVASEVFSSAIRLAIVNIQPNAGPDTLVCPGSTTLLKGIPSGGIWSGAGISPAGQYTAGMSSGSAVLTYRVSRHGCSRTDTRLVTIPDLPSVSFTAQMDTLSAVASGATEFTWYLNDTPIPGNQTDQLVINESGNYCVEAKFSGSCVRRSDCSFQVYSFVSDPSSLIKMSLKPNPSPDELQISWSGLTTRIEIVNSIGQKVAGYDNLSGISEFRIRADQFAKGVYTVVAIQKNGTRLKGRFVRE